MKSFLTALRFLTIIKIRSSDEISFSNLSDSTIFFPYIGALIGLLSLFLFVLIKKILPLSLSLILTIFFQEILSGGLHLDGFADTIDGFSGGKDKQKIISIMRDEYIGVFAVGGLIGLFLIKIYALLSITPLGRYIMIFLYPSLGRWVAVEICAFSTYANSHGTGLPFVKFTGKKEFFVATVLFLFVLIPVAKIKGIFMLFVVALWGFLVILFFSSRLGGITGDIIGFSVEGSELIALILASILFR